MSWTTRRGSRPVPSSGASNLPCRRRVSHIQRLRWLCGYSDYRRRYRSTRHAKTLPVVERGGQFIGESWAIAEWLDVAFADYPRLLSSREELAMVTFFDKWFGTAIMPPMFRSCVYQIFERVRPQEREYFRTTRERTFRQPHTGPRVLQQADGQVRLPRHVH